MGRVHRIRIPLDNFSTEEAIALTIVGGFTVVIADEPCLTCGHKSRVQHVEKTDGKRELIRECLYCMCDNHTFSNRSSV